jgi:hypothetical protein
MTGSRFSESGDVVTYDPEANAYYAQHEWGDDGSLSVTLVTALADVMDVDPMSIKPLGSHVNPDALDSLFDTRTDSLSHASSRLELTIEEHHVTIYADGEIVIRP